MATRLSDPFVKRATTGLPWVIAKWAQTIDGRIATRAGRSRWISGPFLRRRVHRLRSRVDAVMVGAGTLEADDPLLTARDIRVRRVARRVVLVGGRGLDRRVFEAAGSPTTAVFAEGTGPPSEIRAELEGRGVECVDIPAVADAGRVRLPLFLRLLAERHNVTNILVEGGSSLLGSLFDEGLVDEAVVHIAPMVLGDQEGLGAARGLAKASLAEASRLVLLRVKRLGHEVELVYRKA